MAGFRMHVSVSTGCGLVYGAAAVQPLGFETPTAVLAAGVTAVGGMLPDLDSAPGIPLRLTSGMVAALTPILLLPRFHHAGFSHDGTLVGMMAVYLFIRYPVVGLFKRFTVHRGMFHSIPALLVAGLIVYLEYGGDPKLSDAAVARVKLLLAGGVMLGFLSHLVLDEIYSVDFNGVRVKLNSFAGTALKWSSSSLKATMTCYALLGGLGFAAYQDYTGKGLTLPPWEKLLKGAGVRG